MVWLTTSGQPAGVAGSQERVCSSALASFTLPPVAVSTITAISNAQSLRTRDPPPLP
jgi:hypothetical protein